MAVRCDICGTDGWAGAVMLEKRFGCYAAVHKHALIKSLNPPYFTEREGEFELTKPPYSFLTENEFEIERRASTRAQKPLADPFMGGMVVTLGCGLVAKLTLGLAEVSISDYKAEGISTWVGLICGGLAYLFLRYQRNEYYREVDRVTADLWEMRQPKETPTGPNHQGHP